LVEGKRDGKNERIIRKLRQELEHQEKYHKKVKRKYENDIKDLLENKNIKRPLDSMRYNPKPRVEESERKLSVIDMLGKRRSDESKKKEGLIVEKRQTRRSDEKKGSTFIEKVIQENRRIGDDYRQQKIEERQEDIREKNYEEFKLNKQIENTKNLNDASFKRRQDMQKRQETGGNIGQRFADIGIRTPHEKAPLKPSMTYVRNGRRNKGGFWESLVNNNMCTIF
jgi:hypothetical protein